MAEVKLMTKYFGEITIDIDDNSGSSDIMFANEEIGIFLFNYCNYGEKKKTCLEIIDQYIEIHEIAKKAILENFADNQTYNIILNVILNSWKVTL